MSASRGGLSVLAGVLPDSVLERTEKLWDLSRRLPLPRPGWLRCPVCRSADIQLRWWQFHERPKRALASHPWRCDVSWKCRGCAAVWLHGLVVPKSYWSDRPLPGRKTIRRREGLKLLEAS